MSQSDDAEVLKIHTYELFCECCGLRRAYGTIVEHEGVELQPRFCIPGSIPGLSYVVRSTLHEKHATCASRRARTRIIRYRLECSSDNRRTVEVTEILGVLRGCLSEIAGCISRHEPPPVSLWIFILEALQSRIMYQ